MREADLGEVLDEFVEDLAVAKKDKFRVILEVDRVDVELAGGVRGHVDHEGGAAIGEAELSPSW